jgi:hypothetical protein
MKPPRESLKVGDLVDGNPVVEIYCDGDIKTMYISGIIALANAIKDMGAISSVNLLKNGIGIDQAHVLVSNLKDHPTLKSLCGNKGNEVKLDMSGKMNGAAGAIMLVPEITDNGALSVLSLKNNGLLTKGAGKALAQALAGNSVLTEVNVSCQAGYTWDDGPGFAQELAVGIKDNGALIKLDISSNYIAAAQGGDLQRICAAGGIELVK